MVKNAKKAAHFIVKRKKSWLKTPTGIIMVHLYTTIFELQQTRPFKRKLSIKAKGQGHTALASHAHLASLEISMLQIEH